MSLPNPDNQTYTIGVASFLREIGKSTSELFDKVHEFYKIQPDECFDGGNDKFFFSMKFYGQKFFVATNELNGLTIMLPEEY